MTHSLPFVLQHLIDVFLQKQLPFFAYTGKIGCVKSLHLNTFPQVDVSELHLCDSNVVRSWTERAQLPEQRHTIFPVCCRELVHSHQRFIPKDDRVSSVRRTW